MADTERIQRYAARMNRLIGDLTDVASIDAGKLAIAPSLRDLATLIAEAEDSFKAAASAKGISRAFHNYGAPATGRVRPRPHPSGARQPGLQFAQIHPRRAAK